MWRKPPIRSLYVTFGILLNKWSVHLSKETSSFLHMAANNVLVSVKLGSVQGHREKSNEVLLCADRSMKFDSHVIYFGGDVQDFKDNMMSDKAQHQKEYIQWNLENTAEILHKKYPKSVLWIVRPNHLLHHTFSVYSAFLATNFNGSPDEFVEIQGQGSWFHLKELFLNAVTKGVCELNNVSDCHKNVHLPSDNGDACKKSCDNSEKNNLAKETIDSHSSIDSYNIEDLYKLPIHILGFSKGCIVLNQLLYDLEQTQDDESTWQFVKQVKHMTWLDGGHSSRKNTWVTQKDVLSLLKETDIRVDVHVTPYQVHDPMRNWIGKEQRHFTAILRRLGVPVEETLHFGELEASLENHFNVLTVF